MQRSRKFPCIKAAALYILHCVMIVRRIDAAIHRARRIETAMVAAVVLIVGCGGSGSRSFDEGAVKAAVATSSVFDNDTERAQALETFRHVCDGPDDSINESSVHDFLAHPDKYPPEFVDTARVGCPDKFARVQRKIDAGDCFGGPTAGCS